MTDFVERLADVQEKAKQYCWSSNALFFISVRR